MQRSTSAYDQIFPVTYVEAMPEPSPRELQEEAQAEAKVFASLGTYTWIAGLANADSQAWSTSSCKR